MTMKSRKGKGSTCIKGARLPLELCNEVQYLIGKGAFKNISEAIEKGLQTVCAIAQAQLPLKRLIDQRLDSHNELMTWLMDGILKMNGVHSPDWGLNTCQSPTPNDKNDSEFG